MGQAQRCAQCGAPLVAPFSFKPFCSERCQLLDLGAWVTGKYKIPVVEQDEGETSSEADSDDEKRFTEN